MSKAPPFENPDFQWKVAALLMSKPEVLEAYRESLEPSLFFLDDIRVVVGKIFEHFDQYREPLDFHALKRIPKNQERKAYTAGGWARVWKNIKAHSRRNLQPISDELGNFINYQLYGAALSAGVEHRKRGEWELIHGQLDEVKRRLSSLNGSIGPWSKALSAPDLLKAKEEVLEWIEPNMLAPGSVTEIFSPRGIGKTLVAHEMAVRLSLLGFKVLILDRDNSYREVVRRLRGWGAEEAKTLKVLTRDQVPPLSDGKAWEDFPFSEYDVVIIDSLDSTAEGVGEKDSAKPSKALSPILDIAHRPNGPAILILGNTVKTGQHSRGSGVVEDRADIVYEVRDATDLKPSGKPSWWMELPNAGAADWGDRASRRKKRNKYRLAFIPTKFRVGAEPEPFILEIDLSGDLWTVRDVTDSVVYEGKSSREEMLVAKQLLIEVAVRELKNKIEKRSNTKEPLSVEQDAVTFLRNNHGFTRKDARRFITDNDEKYWVINVLKKKGEPQVLTSIENSSSVSNVTAEINTNQGNPVTTRVSKPPICATPMNTGRQKSAPLEPSVHAGFRERHSLPPEEMSNKRNGHRNMDTEQLRQLMRKRKANQKQVY